MLPKVGRPGQKSSINAVILLAEEDLQVTTRVLSKTFRGMEILWASLTLHHAVHLPRLEDIPPLRPIARSVCGACEQPS